MLLSLLLVQAGAASSGPVNMQMEMSLYPVARFRPFRLSRTILKS